MNQHCTIIIYLTAHIRDARKTNKFSGNRSKNFMDAKARPLYYNAKDARAKLVDTAYDYPERPVEVSQAMDEVRNALTNLCNVLAKVQ